MELEIKVMWCKGLTTAFNFFQKLTVYATVSITSSNDKIQLTQHQKQEQKTPVDEKGEGDPEWNYSMKFDLRPLYNTNPSLDDLCLLFELRSPGQIFGDKSIGEVRVPLKELIQSVGHQVVRFVKYEVRNSEGKHNGILDFSYKLIGNVHDSGIFNPNHHVQITGYHHHHDPPYHNQQSLHQNHEQHHTFSETIQYPSINLDEPSPPPLVYPPSSSSSSYYYASSSSFTSTYGTHYNPPAAHSYPPSSSQIWAPQPTHYPPPPVQQPYVYPPPPQQQQPPPYGDPHWGFQRAGSYHHW